MTLLVIFTLVYLGMVLGGLPFLALDRTGVALLGAIACVGLGLLSLDAAWEAVDVPTMALLFGLMVVSAQFRLGGFYAAVTRRLAGVAASPPTLLALVVGTSGLLSALLANDIICLAMAPMLVEGLARRDLDPRPHLLGLACAANIGSAATLIGNPQNMLIGQVLQLDFGAYCLTALPPVLLGLVVAWGLIALLYRGRWQGRLSCTAEAPPPFCAWQTGKGLAVLLVLVALFLAGIGEREVLALGAAGLLLLSRRMASRSMLALVDWQLLLLFLGLFVVNAAMAQSGWLEQGARALAGAGVDLADPGSLFVLAAVLSNLVSNVPAVMLLLPHAQDAGAGTLLALSSTLAGNLFVVGSIANIIVLVQAQLLGVRIGWLEHARTGVPVTLVTLALTAGWLGLF